MTIPLVNLGRQYEELCDELREAVDGVMERGDFILSEEVDAFEQEFADYCGVKHCIGVGSGFDALTLSLRAYRIGPGDEVLTAANTFAATALAITAVGATPVLVDHDPQTYGIDPTRLSAAITSRTKAIIPVHLYGHPADMDLVNAVASEHGLVVIEDACQAHGARYKQQRCGSLGHAAAFSFYPAKNLGAIGDGGAIVTDNDEAAAWLRSYRNYGSSVKYFHEIPGVNSRLDSVHAAVLRVKLRYLDEWNDTRRWLASQYCELLAGAQGVILPTECGDIGHVYHLFVIRVAHRDRMLAYLRAKGIGAAVHYPVPLHRQQAFDRKCIYPPSLPITDACSDEILSLPICPFLRLDELETVVHELHCGIASLPQVRPMTSSATAT